MAWITQRWGVPLATLFATVSIVGAYLLGTGALKPLQANAISPASLLQSIATKDSDHDGLPNWEEALYGTNPYKADTFGLGMTDGEAVARGLIVPKAFTLPSTVATSTQPKSSTTTPYDLASKPGTLTSLFAKNLLSSYLTHKALNNGAKLSKQQMNDIVQQAMGQINIQATQQTPYRTLSQIKVSGSGEVAMRAYATAVQKAFSKHTITQDKGVLTYLQEAEQNPSTASVPLAHVRAIAGVYRDSAASLAQMTVPREVLQAHFELVNAYAQMANVSDSLSKVISDPITAMLALSEYKKDVLALAKGFTDMGTAFQSAGVTLAPSDPGASFVNLISSLAKEQHPKTQS